MRPHRIHITGASGSGVSTLGAALAEALRLRWLDADDYYWESTTPPFQIKRSRSERLKRLLNDTATGSYVLSGSVVAWGPEVEDAFDMIVFLVVPTEVRLERLRRRETERLGMPDDRFLDWASRYDSAGPEIRSRSLHEDWLARRSAPVVRVEGTPPVDETLRIVVDILADDEHGPTPNGVSR